MDFSDVEWFEEHLPPNMAMWGMTYLFQQVSNLIGLEPMCLMLYEDRDLVEAVTARVGAFFLEYTKALCSFSRVGAINVGEDMGHKTSTPIDPALLRTIFLPWHRQFIAAAHRAGKLGFFHVCGQRSKRSWTT